MSPKATLEAPAQRDPTLREMRATLGLLWSEIDNRGGEQGAFYERVYGHFAWLLDSYLFDTDSWDDEGGRS